MLEVSRPPDSTSASQLMDELLSYLQEGKWTEMGLHQHPAPEPPLSGPGEREETLDCCIV
jgi:hypothetical protein